MRASVATPPFSGSGRTVGVLGRLCEIVLDVELLRLGVLRVVVILVRDDEGLVVGGHKMGWIVEKGLYGFRGASPSLQSAE